MLKSFLVNFKVLFRIHHEVYLVAMVNLGLKELPQFMFIKLVAKLYIAMVEEHKL